MTAELKNKNEILETLAIRDELTGLYIRYYMDRWIENDLEKGKYGNMPISMAVLDLDHFKVVNDRYGHMIGDKVLQQLSDLLKATTREKDILVRVGGEEIVVIMPGINKKDALKIAEEFRCLICNCRLPIEGHLSASFGVAERKPSESFEKWLERADQHYMKRNKRGKTRCTLLINIRNKADVPSIFGRESVFPNKIDARGDGFAEVFSFRGEGYRLSGILFVLYNLKFVKSPPNN